MISELGKIALERNLPEVIATVIKTKKNQPARDFLERVVAPFREAIENGYRYVIPASIAAECVLSHASIELEPTPESGGEAESRSVVSQMGVSHRYERIATELFSAERVLAVLENRSKRGRSHSELNPVFIAPRTGIEQEVADLWGDLLRIEPVGIHDNFFELGGTSTCCRSYCPDRSAIWSALPLTSLIEAPTVEQFAAAADGRRLSRLDCLDSRRGR